VAALLGAALCLSLAGTGSAYLLSGEGELYKCDKALIESDAYGVKDKDLCLGFCDRVDDVVTSMQEQAPDKKCYNTAVALVSVLDSSGETLKNLLKTIHHDGSCLALLMPDWTARHAACQKAADASGDSTMDRIKMILLQHYSAKDATPPHRRAGDAEAATNDDQRRAGDTSGLKPQLENFCLVQLETFAKKGLNLFDETACQGLHPIWSTMEECPAACWEYMKPLLQENGCVALYYDTIFAMTFNSGRKATEDFTGALKDKFKVSELELPAYATLEDKCKDRTPPCAHIDTAISQCAKKGNVKSGDIVFYTSKVMSRKTFDRIENGGVKCWQGMHCH